MTSRVSRLIYLSSFLHSFFMFNLVEAHENRCASYIIDVESEKGLATFSVEIADTPEERELGLMLRPYLPIEHGMLFIWPEAAPRSFWMKNTYISLDIIFIDENGRICDFSEFTTPLSETMITSQCGAKAVLEINAGLISRLGIKTGNATRHPIFPTTCNQP